MSEKRLRRIPVGPIHPGFPEGIIDSMAKDLNSRRHFKISVTGPITDVSLSLLILRDSSTGEAAIFNTPGLKVTLDSENGCHRNRRAAIQMEEALRAKRGR